MFLQNQGIDDDGIIIDRVRQARGLSDNNGDVVRGRGIDGTSEGLETTTEEPRTQGQQRRMGCL